MSYNLGGSNVVDTWGALAGSKPRITNLMLRYSKYDQVLSFHYPDVFISWCLLNNYEFDAVSAAAECQRQFNAWSKSFVSCPLSYYSLKILICSLNQFRAAIQAIDFSNDRGMRMENILPSLKEKAK